MVYYQHYRFSSPTPLFGLLYNQFVYIQKNSPEQFFTLLQGDYSIPQTDTHYLPQFLYTRPRSSAEAG